MLVAAFEVEVGGRAFVALGPGQFGPAAAAQHEGVGAARIEPHVEDVGDALVVLGPVLVAEVFLCPRVGPGVDPALADAGDDPRVDGRIVEVLVGALLDEQRDRHAPGALARQHPVGPPFHHRADAVLALLGHPAGLADGLERELAQRGGIVLERAALVVPALARGAFGMLDPDCAVHRHEPLRRAAEDHLGLGTPRVRVGVLVVGAGGEQPAGRA